MCGICLAIDTNKTIALNELIRNNLQTEKQLDFLTESIGNSELITSTAYDLIKKSITEKSQYTLLPMAGADNLNKLYELALIKTNMWDNTKVLRVHILPHTFDLSLNTFIEQYANDWVPFSGIAFQFVHTKQAEIIIELNGNGFHSSQIGKDALNYSSRGIKTMNLGIGTATSIEHIRRPVIHEFGHALGCIHEHQSPAASVIQWNEPAVIRSYALGGWDEATVRHNVFGKYSSGIVTNSQFDGDSIMLYPIDASHTLDGFSAPWNTALSALDKSFMKKAYSII
jgi:hypothetical protein